MAIEFSSRNKAAIEVGKDPGLYIGGSWIWGDGEPSISIDPSTEETLASVAVASTAQVDHAIAAAGRGFRTWRAVDPIERGRVFERIVERARTLSESLVDVTVAETGAPIALARMLHVGVSLDQLAWLSHATASGPTDGGWQYGLPPYDGPMGRSQSLIRREPIGVVVAITPYNIPFIGAALKAAAALAAGCSVILLPSPQAQLSSMAFAKIFDDVGLPDGAFNLVLGGPEIGRRLTESAAVACVSFTGSDAVGSAVMAQGAATIKRVILELGGKSPNILLPGADVDLFVQSAVLGLCRGAGQGCISLTRTLVPRPVYARFVEAARGALEGVVVGDPRKPETVVGPLITSRHRDRVRGFVTRAVAAGGRIEAEGKSQLPERGYFMNPVLIGGIDNTAEIAQNELFGPVGVLLPYDDVEDAIAIANDSRYGLNANIVGPRDEAMAVAVRLESGMVAINGGGWLRPDAPFGGYKMSGLGREYGTYGFEEFLETKHIHWPA